MSEEFERELDELIDLAAAHEPVMHIEPAAVVAGGRRLVRRRQTLAAGGMAIGACAVAASVWLASSTGWLGAAPPPPASPIVTETPTVDDGDIGLSTDDATVEDETATEDETTPTETATDTGVAAPPTTAEPVEPTGQQTTEPPESTENESTAPETTSPEETTPPEETTDAAPDFPEHLDDYIEVWVEEWSQGDFDAAAPYASSAPSVVVTCLGDTAGEWVYEYEGFDMSEFAENLWGHWATHEPTGALLMIYADQSLRGQAHAVIGADLSQNDGGGLPELQDCFADDVLAAAEAWNAGDDSLVSVMANDEIRSQLDELRESQIGENAGVLGLSSFQYYGTPETSNAPPEVGVLFQYDFDPDLGRPGNPLWQFDPDAMDGGQNTDGTIFRMTSAVDRRFV